MPWLFIVFVLAMASPAWAGIPATPVMTLYRFNGPVDFPYYAIDSFLASGPSTPAGTLAQGTSVTPCLVVRNGEPLTDREGIPYVGFEVVVDARTATPTATARYNDTLKARQAMTVANHHCGGGVRFVLDVRNLYALAKPPLFDPPAPAPQAGSGGGRAGSELDAIIRAFHNSPACAAVNQRLPERRSGLNTAWNRFIADQQHRWSNATLQRAKHLDYTMRTALFEGHLERGCNSYGACERNIIVLSIRNRGLDGCSARLGCREPGDFQGVAARVSQYNIWDEVLTQVSGLTSCYLRTDLADRGSGGADYRKWQSMHAQSVADAERILFGTDRDLTAIFPNNTLADLKNLRHYYHAPAMGKCFPRHPRVEYMSGAVARRGNDFALLANTRIQVGEKTGTGYFFRSFIVREDPARDVITLADHYPGFVVDGRRVSLSGPPSRCTAYGIPGGCRFDDIGRYRRTPPWVNAGKPLEVTCTIADRGEQCQTGEQQRSVRVGGVCDPEMRPFSGIN